jgi:hypothetical protein
MAVSALLSCLQVVAEIPTGVAAGAAQALSTRLRSTRLASQRLLAAALSGRLLHFAGTRVSSSFSEWQTSFA